MVKAIVGANWGDEGKGKITDMLAEHSDIVVRFQGGCQCRSHHHQRLWPFRSVYPALRLFLLPCDPMSSATAWHWT